MSFSIDTNILIYASNSRSPLREAASRFLHEATTGIDLLFLAWSVIFGYLRIVTHPSILGEPLHPDEARRNIDDLLAFPNVRLLPEGPDLWQTYSSVSKEVIVRGDFVSDAHLAATLRHHGVSVLYTNDSDFRKFRFLEVRNPFQ